MRATLDEVKEQIQFELIDFEQVLADSVKSRAKFMNVIMNYIIKRRGKQIRPLFIYLCAGCFGKISPSTSRGAALVELLHTATLVHDDVVDESFYRRGFLSINAIWKNKLAVLVGDYLLSRGLLLAIDNGDFGLLKIVSNAVREMSEGELLQLEKSKKLDITEAIYFDIIRQKTAVLLSSSCAVGAQSGGATEQQVELARRFGERVGIAFQLKDDLLDYSVGPSGKPTAQDIQMRKLSLPLIHGLEKASWDTRFTMWMKIRRKKKSTLDVSQLLAFAQDSGGIAYAETKLNETVQDAYRLLDQFPPSCYQDSLRKLVGYVMARVH